MRSFILFFVSLTFIVCASCGRKPENDQLKRGITDLRSDSIPGDSGIPAGTNEYQLLATLFTQASAEYRALCYQSFRAARYALQADLDSPDHEKRRAVVLDIDETVLDNSPYQAACITQGISYPQCWDEWCMQAIAEPVPGVTDFISFARMNHVEVFFITNRKEHLYDATLKNLAAIGIKNIDQDHLLMRIGENSKEPRRYIVRDKFHISLLIGDNLADFSSIFEGLSTLERAAATDSLRNYFGERYIILPNTMYGDWTSAMYKNQRDLTAGERRQMHYDALRAADCQGSGTVASASE